MEVICLQDDAFLNLIDRVIKRVDETLAVKDDQWISGDQVMKMLGITSKTTLQNLRDNGEVRFSQPRKKVILYDRNSVLNYLNKNTRKTF